MFILTDSIENIVISISELTSCSLREIETFSREIYDGCEENSIIYMDRIRKKVMNFMEIYAKAKIEMVCMHHLTRRLNGYSDGKTVGNNLHDLLCKESPLTSFLASFMVEFTSDNEVVRMLYRGQEVNVGVGPAASIRLKLRLGQLDKNARDHCINGFAFADRLEKNNYFSYLSYGPEILQDIAEVLHRPEIIEAYKRQSSYYRYTFLLPISLPIMNSTPDATNDEKAINLLAVCFCRMHDLYCEPNRKAWYDHDNILMQLNKNDSLSTEFLFRRTLVDD